MPKQKSNDKCLCGSDKKYKNCCMIWKATEPVNPSQEVMRHIIDHKVTELSKGERCCKVCADTIDDGELIDLNTTNGKMTFCRFCYNVQTSNLIF